MKNNQINVESLKEHFQKKDNIVIYGAGVVAYGIYQTFKNEFGKLPEAFVVTEKRDNDDSIENIPVLELRQFMKNYRNQLVVIATPEIYHTVIKEELEAVGVQDVFYITGALEYIIMCEYFKRKNEFPILDIKTNSNQSSIQNTQAINDVEIYMAKSHFDKKLKSCVERAEWVIPIHVGAALTNESITDLCDNVGENISNKNRNYSELTATYWVWKNVHKAYKGICHYRRQLLFTPEELVWIKENDIDVVLPLPYICYPDTSGQYGRYIDEEDQKILFQALRDVSREYAIAAEKILEDKYLYNYNMLLAKEEVFDEYCQWMFPILFYAEELRKKEKPGVEDRFAGYFGEVLTSLFFLKNRKRFKIIHAEKKWYI